MLFCWSETIQYNKSRLVDESLHIYIADKLGKKDTFSLFLVILSKKMGSASQLRST